MAAAAVAPMLRSARGMRPDPPDTARSARMPKLGSRACLVVALAPLACGEVPLLTELSPEESCRRTALVGPLGVPVDVVEAREQAATDSVAAADGESMAAGTTPARVEVDWKVPASDAERHRLNAWCAAVGPALFGGWADPPVRPVDSVAVVSWNLHVGGGDLPGLVRDLRDGVFTGGRSVEHFVLLLQEAYREDDSVPAFESGMPLGGGVYAIPPDGVRRDIVAEAEALGLSLFYAPSMRNGEGIGDDAPEDRGNAILSTLPLADPLAIELPVARQRRVAISARVPLGPGDEARSLRVTSVHLENDASGFMRDEQARLEQARALIAGIPDHDIAIAGGDFNTWARAQDEALIALMLRAYPDTPPFPAGHTYVRGYGLVRRYLDYLFFRLPDAARARVLRVPDPYASDHFPLVGWAILPPDP